MDSGVGGGGDLDVLSARRCADILTKHVGGSLLDKHAGNMGIFIPSGRAESAFFFPK